MKNLIKNGRLIDPAENKDGAFDILISKGKVERVEPAGQIADDKNIKIIDAKGLVVAPGFIDMHVHFR